MIKKNFLKGLLAATLTLGISNPMSSSVTATTSKSHPTLQSKAESSLEKKIDRLLENKIVANADVGVKIVDIEKQKVIYGKDAKKLLTPASNMKIITSAAALSKLKPHYVFKTVFYTDGKIKKDTAEGNLYVKGFGDPSMVNEKLLEITSDLYNRGIREIKGDIIIDDSFFDNNKYSPAHDEHLDEVDRAFMAPTGAFSINFNTVQFYVKPAQEGKKPYVAISPMGYANFTNKAKTGKQNSYFNLSIFKPNPEEDNFVVDGVIPSDFTTLTFYRSIANPSMYGGKMLKTFMEKGGIKVKGEVKIGVTPEGASEIINYSSKPLSLVVMDLNKWSSNFIADQIVKTIGAETTGKPGSFENGFEVMKNFLEEIGIEKGSYTIADGSGLSEKNKISPEQIIKVLSFMYNNFESGPEFVASLAIGGVDGTLDERLIDMPNVVRAKTGHIDSVSCLSGYLLTKQHKVVAFSMMMNNFNPTNVEEVRELQDSIIKTIIEDY